MDNFTKQLELGKKGENIVIDYLNEKFEEVVDVSDDKKYQDMDVDFLCYRHNDKGEYKEFKVELKTDYRMDKTGNLFFELSHERKTGTYKGFFYKSQADFLLNLNANTNKLYVVPFRHKWRTLAYEQCRKVRFWNKWDDCYSNGMVISIEKAKELGIICTVVQL